jgi:hypothetical protein
MPNPPQAAELILRALLPADARECVSGDLLEEYREARVPSAGQFRADLWYWRQVGGIWLRAYWWLVAPVVLLLAFFDTLNYVSSPLGASFGLPTGLPFAVQPPLVAVGLVASAAAYGSWRTRRWQGGFVAALGVSAILWSFAVVWSNATFYPFALRAQSDPQWIAAWHWSTEHGHAPRNDTFLNWLYWDNVGSLIIAGLVLLVTSFVCGGVGAILGEVMSHRRRRP